ncbi:hypothetical protein ESZ53_13805 [Salinibacterium sp. UTAS2018]|uniref:threonine/serine ThrE exporter family protein n=1 Tax=Salinibacterium sp. UTAS2018 TaxID=2508880 RepID=UPI0010094BC5|nr:threonine/serine exporter family protein [Salinibacterium sp. UTAS2018]QAV71416.1 hypothetical protein ESZ53_13805 [Salinibacterium sp. UTAS2018]
MAQKRRYPVLVRVLALVACAGALAAPAALTVSSSSPASAAIVAVDEPGAPDAVATATPTPAPTVTTRPATPAPTPATTLSPTETPTASPTASPSPTASLTPAPTPTPTPTEQSPAPVSPLPAIPPSVATSNVSLTTLLIAVTVLAASIVVLWLILRRRPQPKAAATSAHRSAAPPRAQSAAVTLDALAELGSSMVDSGYPVSMVRTAVQDVATANGFASATVVVFPTALFVSLDNDGATLTRAVSAGGRSYLLHQVDVIDRIMKVGRARSGSADWVSRQIAKVRELAPPFSAFHRVAAYALTTGAIAVLLGSSWLGVLVAAVLGIGVGTLLLLGERLPSSYDALVIVSAALGSSLIILLVARATDDSAILPSLIAPLVVLLPGGLLTTAVIELATGHIMSGSARAAAGAMRLLLLAVGIVSAGALIGVPRIELEASGEVLGPIAPWIAIAVFGVGISVYQCARPASIPWILLVLYVAYGAQVIGDVLFGGVLSALIGAIAMTPVAVLVARHRTGPPAIVSFLPAFWLLVPGGLGLVGVTEALGGGDASGTLITTVGTMIAIALGVLIGLAASSTLRDRRLPSLFAFLDPVPDAETTTDPVTISEKPQV